jgi:Domain of unknown function (DUF4145)
VFESLTPHQVFKGFAAMQTLFAFYKIAQPSTKIGGWVMKYVAPSLAEQSFTCPYCGAYAKQHRGPVLSIFANLHGNSLAEEKALARTICHACKRDAIWVDGEMVRPSDSTAPMPHEDLPEDCRSDYLEARSILSKSPRGAAALLRLVIQKLMPHIGGKGANISDDIGALVKAGLDATVQQALDSCRVIGNNAVHPGELSLQDTPEMAAQMCHLINFIVDNRITQPKRIKAIYAALPAGAIAAIEKRDGATSVK